MYNNQNQNNIELLVGVLSLILGCQNLNENRQQSAHNDVQVANDRQARYMLEEITRQFEEQNKILENQNVMLERLLELLEKEK